MYLAGISVRRVEDITEALCGTRVSPSTVSNLNKKIYAKIEAWRNRRIEGEHPYLYCWNEESSLKSSMRNEIGNQLCRPTCHGPSEWAVTCVQQEVRVGCASNQRGSTRRHRAQARPI